MFHGAADLHLGAYCPGLSLELSLAAMQWRVQDFSKEGARRRKRRWGGEPKPPLQKNHFCPQNGKFGCIPKTVKFDCILTQFLTGRKHGQSLAAFGYGFYGSIAK